MIYIDIRTGLKFENRKIALRLGYCKPITYNKNPISPSYGKIDNHQRGIQFWMDSDYTGTEPDKQVKRLTMMGCLDYKKMKKKYMRKCYGSKENRTLKN